MKTVHRLIAILASVLMLYLGTTGSLMQIIDLHALLTHTPESDPTMQSINEGINGQFDYAVLTERDYTAAALPEGLNFAKALSTVLRASHKYAPNIQPRLVELRVVDGAVVGQVSTGTNIDAFNAGTGESVAAVNIRPPYVPPPSLRETVKDFHRFWFTNDVPGVWAELGCGVILWALIITGLVTYFRLLSARAQLGRRQFFWLSGGLWRGLHRAVAVAAAVFLIAIAASGSLLGFEGTWRAAANPRPVDASAPLSDEQVQQMARAALNAFRREEPQTPIKVLRLRVYGTMKQGVVVVGSEPTRQLAYNTDTGKLAGLTEPGYPSGGFPFGRDVHQAIKHFHSGYMFGLTARWMDLFGGLSLIFLSGSGIFMYFDLWWKRRKTGRRSVFWF